MDKNKAVDDEAEAMNSAIAAMSGVELVQLWNGMIDVDRVVAGDLFMEALLGHAAAGYGHQPKEDRPKVQVQPRQPPSANKPSSPPFTAPAMVVLALRAPDALLAGGQPNKTTTTTTAARAHGGKKPQSTPVGPRKEGSEEHPQARSLMQKPRQPPASKADQKAPQNSYKTVTVLCAPPHLAREMKRPSTTSTECATQGKKHRAV